MFWNSKSIFIFQNHIKQQQTDYQTNHNRQSFIPFIFSLDNVE